MKYDLYHDESKVDGYWHGMLLVPLESKDWILDRLQVARKNTGYFDPLGIKNVREENRIYSCAKAWLTIAVASMRTKEKKAEPIPIYLGNKYPEGPIYEPVYRINKMKFILFREKDAHQKMNFYYDHGSKIETTLRFALKGGLNYLGSRKNPIFINSLHFDGHKHYRRNVDRARIVDRLHSLRDYCEISDRRNLIYDDSSNHNRSDCQKYTDCQFLQLADLLIGAFRSILIEPTRKIHTDLAYPIKSLILRYQNGIARMENSRWWNSFCMSQCYLENNNWKFETLKFDPDLSEIQPNLI
jgi:hypothetical protein